MNKEILPVKHFFLAIICLTLIAACNDDKDDKLQNHHPIAKIKDISNSLKVNQEILLDGTESLDSDKQPLSYEWFLISKPLISQISLSDKSKSLIRFVPDVSGEYIFNLVVSDGQLESNPAEIHIKIKDKKLVDLFIHAHPDDIELFMASSAYHAIKNNHEVIFILMTSGDGGLSKLISNRKESILYPDVRILGHEAAVGYWAQSNAVIDKSTLIDTHIVYKRTYEPNVAMYDLKFPDGGLKGQGYENTGFQSLEKLDNGTINSISTLDNNVYNGINDIHKTLADIINSHTVDADAITIHLPETNTFKNNGSHADHLITGKIVQDTVFNNFEKCVQLISYADYQNGNMPKNMSPDDEIIHYKMFEVMTDKLVENGIAPRVKNTHLDMLGKQYVTSDISANCK